MLEVICRGALSRQKNWLEYCRKIIGQQIISDNELVQTDNPLEYCLKNNGGLGGKASELLAEPLARSVCRFQRVASVV